ncbi:hypothetical protein [Cohnella kolymensis]|uniref:hypothetical protein n=1 Tax=Cohnella kolymensis TaxID=1590652 RepID=UPI001269CF76|nr:hypothetical protein [Cohnella kolymensis]
MSTGKGEDVRIDDSSMYLPSTEGTEFGDSPFPMQFGYVQHPQESRIVIRDKATGLSKQAKIVEISRDFKLFYVFLDKSQGQQFEITTYNADGKMIRQESIDESLLSNASEGTETIQGEKLR